MKNLSVYPLLFAAFPSLSLLANNIMEIPLIETYRSVLVSISLALGLILLFRRAFKNHEKAAIMTTITLMLLFSYGHVYHLLRDILPNGLALIRHRYLAGFIFIGYVVFLLALNRSKLNFQQLTYSLNLVACILLIFPVFNIVSAKDKIISLSQNSQKLDPDCNLNLPSNYQTPDVYYIILDSYPREDILERIFDFNNEPFLEELESLGFFIIDGSQSNYATSYLSLSSALNMKYLVDDEEFRNDSVNQNLVRKELECVGYASVGFDNGLVWSNWGDADIFLSYKDYESSLWLLSNVNAFESMLIYNSAGLIVLDTSITISDILRQSVDNPFIEHQNNVIYALEELGTSVPKLPSPKIVFAHIISPHSPPIFDSNGGRLDPSGAFTLKDNDEGQSDQQEDPQFKHQLISLNERVIKFAKGIIDKSQSPPIIIIQSDHGLGGGEAHMSILMALYLPNVEESLLYETISPVNVFRFVFNEYFGGDYEILEDISYFSWYKDRFDFTVIPNTWSEK